MVYRTNRERILVLLREQPGREFRAAEIAAETGIARNSVNPVLATLRDEGLVHHERPFWSLANQQPPAPPGREACKTQNEQGVIDSVRAWLQSLRTAVRQ